MPSLRALVRVAALAGALTANAGCVTMPSERAEAPPLPSAWRDAPQGADLPITDWWRGFNDPALDQLVAEALAEGPDMRIAISRVREARALSYATITQYLPELTATARGEYQRVLDGPILGSDREEFASIYGAQVSWELPLFAIGATAVGARAGTQAALADYRGAQVALVADVAQAYVDLRAAQASYAALTRSVETADELARILDTAARAGFALDASRRHLAMIGLRPGRPARDSAGSVPPETRDDRHRSKEIPCPPAPARSASRSPSSASALCCSPRLPRPMRRRAGSRGRSR